MKDLILLKAYCPTKEKEQMLSNLVESIDTNYFDILITSHTPISKNIQNKVNYVFYDEKNTLYHDMESAPYYWSSIPENNGYFYHTKLHHPLHILAILRLERFGYQISKMLGYKKVHSIEYDSLVLDNKIFLENSYLLNTYDAVIYKNENLAKDCIHGSFKSVKVNSLSEDLIDYNEKKVKNYFKYNKKRILPEQYTFDLFTKLNTCFLSSQKLENYIETAKNSSPNEKPYEIVPFVKEDKLYIFDQSSTPNQKIKYSLQINDNIIEKNINPLSWSYFPLGVYNDINFIKVEIDNKIYLELDFNKDNNRTIFKKRHFFLKNLQDYNI